MALKPFWNKKYHLGKDPEIIKIFFDPVTIGSVPVTARRSTGTDISIVLNYNNTSCENATIPEIDVRGIPSEILYKLYFPTNLPPQTIIPTQEYALTLLSDGYLEIPDSVNPVTYKKPVTGQQIIVDLGVAKLHLSEVETSLYKGLDNLPAIPAFGFSGGLYETVVNYGTTSMTKIYFTKII